MKYIVLYWTGKDRKYFILHRVHSWTFAQHIEYAKSVISFRKLGKFLALYPVMC